MLCAKFIPKTKSIIVIIALNPTIHFIMHPSRIYFMIVVKTNKQKEIISPIIICLFNLRSRSMELLIAVARFIKAYSFDCFMLFNSSTLPHREAYTNVIMETKIPMIAK